MPIIKSAKKRVRVATKQSIQNAKTRKTMRNAIKDAKAAIESGKKVGEAQIAAQGAIDTAIKKKVISKNRGARLNSRLNVQAKIASGGKRKPVKKTPAKKSTTKPATKKKTVKKTSTKKAPKK